MSPCCCEPDAPATVGQVLLAPGARPAGDELMRRIGLVSKDIGLPILIKSGDRTAWEAYNFRMMYLRGTGNLAARCCSKYSGIHSWSACGKNPWSNHARGRAIDCGTVRGGQYSSIGYSTAARASMRKHGLCLPVPGEKWHVEIGTTWRS